MEEKRFEELYAKVGAQRVADIFSALSGVKRNAMAIRQWKGMIKHGKGLPDWVCPYLSRLNALLELEVANGRK